MKHRRKLSGAEVIVITGCVILAILTLGAAGESARQLAQELACLGNQEVLTGAWLAYADDNDGRLVGGGTGTITSQGQWVAIEPGQATLDQKLSAIKQGLLFPYVGDLNAYHCPADQKLNDFNEPAFRTYSIAGGANGEFWVGYTQARVYSDLENPARRYVFIEEADPRGFNVGSWQMNPKEKTWVDPLAMWHKDSTTLGFADGHAEVRRWRDRSLIDWCNRGMQNQGFAFYMTPPDDEQEDVTYMAQGFPYKALR